MILKKYTLYSSADDRYLSRLINLIFSVKINSPSVGDIIVNDIGINPIGVRILKKIPNVRINKIPKFSKYWNVCFSWKIYAHHKNNCDLYFHLDAGNTVRKDISIIYEQIERDGYFLIDQGQKLTDILTDDLIKKYNVEDLNKTDVFAAGNFGINRRMEKNVQALSSAYSSMLEGLNLGYSINEISKDRAGLGIVQPVPCFRHDQSVLNAAFYSKYKRLNLAPHDIFAAVHDNERVVIYNQRRITYEYIKLRDLGFLNYVYLICIDIYFKMVDILSKLKLKFRSCLEALT
ncbi:hypothetical protein [Aeromonas hydrophila]|uniref:hypothetical protein n=1 Tax=Aeromonas hydrophila TaxID=644 RepID=UPI0011163985|nr:hypothetical protein [Aeromonas hydrophila]